MPRKIDVPAGTIFGLFCVKGETADKPGYVDVVCNCGVNKSVAKRHLRSGAVVSCGCEAKRRAGARAAHMRTGRAGHGLSHTRAYSIWHGMRQRCGNPGNPFFGYYGARGIAVCERWSDFAAFYADMGEPAPGMTLDRIDNNGPYSPDNCRWATRTEQQNNRRANRLVTIEGETLTVAEWSVRSGVHHNTITQRIDSGRTGRDLISPNRFVNLDQVRACAKASSVARKARTHCRYGHEYTPENTGIQARGRYCKRCAAEAEARRRTKIKAAE